MKKFYTLVTCSESKAGGYSIHLDGKAVKTPMGALLIVPSKALADMVVIEWADQDEDIIPDTMPVTQLIVTAQDRVAKERDAMVPAILGYIDTDLICYRIEGPGDLRAAQEAAWDPWLNWLKESKSVELSTTFGLLALEQNQQAHEVIAKIVHSYDLYDFTVFQIVVSLSGSIVLSMAFVEGEITVDELFDTIMVDEIYKAKIYEEEKYGSAPTQIKQEKAMRRDLIAAHALLTMQDR